MGLIDDVVSAITGGLNALGNLIDGMFETIVPVDLIGSTFGDTVEDVQPFDEAAGALTDSLEEFVLSDLEEAGELDPENVEDLLDRTEGGATSLFLGLLAADILMEDAEATLLDSHGDLMAEGVGLLSLTDLVGREVDARLQEGVDPALKQKVHSQHRSKQADFKDFTEVNKRAKWTDGQIPEHTGDIPEEVRDLHADNDFGYLPDPEFHGTIPDETPLYEYAGLEHLEPEEIVEEAPQFGVVPSRAAMEQVLHTSGLPEDVKQVYLDLHEQIPLSADLIEQSNRLGEVVFEIDQKILDGDMNARQALQIIQPSVAQYVTVSDHEGTPIGEEFTEDQAIAIVLSELFARFRLFESLPNSGPSRGQIERWWRNAVISTERFISLNKQFGLQPQYAADMLKDNAARVGADDIRKQFAQGRLTQGQATFRLRLKGWSRDQALQILSGRDPDTIVDDLVTAPEDTAALEVELLTEIGTQRGARLRAQGIDSVGDVANLSVSELAERAGMSDQEAREAFEDAQALLAGGPETS